MIGVIGLGAMGGGIVSTLLRARYELCVYDIDSSRLERAADAGAPPGADAASVVRSCDVLLLSLPSSAVTVQVLEDEVLPAAGRGCVVIDLGTTVVRETQRLCRLFRERGVALLDAPVSGGPVGAATGGLFMFVGGDREAVDGNWKLLSVLAGSRLTYCGPSGSGQITKAVNQLAMGLVDAAFLEAIAFGVTAGVDAAVLLNAVGGDAGFRRQFRAIADSVISGNAESIDAKFAEFPYFLDEADRRGFDAPVLRSLAGHLRDRAKTHRDTMGRPFPPLWNALLPPESASSPEGDASGEG